MRAYVALLVAALSVSLSVACASAARNVPRGGDNDVRDFMRVASRNGFAEEVVDSAPEQVWRVAAGRGTLGPVALGDRVAAVATVDRFVYLLDARTGRMLWRNRGDAPFTTGPVIGRERVYAATGSRQGKVIAIGLHSGKRRWGTTVGDVAMPIVLYDSTIYGATQGGTLFALKAGNGHARWTRRLTPIRSAPLVSGSRVAVVTLTDSLLVFDAASGRPLVRAALPGGSAVPLALADDSTVVVTSPTAGVMLVTLTTGAIRWRVATGSPIFGAPVVARDSVFVLSNDCRLMAIPIASPIVSDSTALGCVTIAPPVLVHGGVLVATIHGELFYYDRVARRRVWTRTIRGDLRQPPAVRHGQIVVAPTVGDVVSLR